MQYLQHLLLLAVLDERLQAFVGYVCYEVVCIGASLQEDLHDGVERGFHYSFEAYEHFVEGDQADSADGRPEGVGEFDQGADQALQLVHGLQDQALMVLADLPYDVASLELRVPFFAVYSLPLRYALLELLLRLVQRLQVLESDIIDFARLSKKSWVAVHALVSVLVIVEGAFWEVAPDHVHSGRASLFAMLRRVEYL